TIVRATISMTRSDKKDTTCERYGKELSIPQRLRTHLERDNPCRPRISPGSRLRKRYKELTYKNYEQLRTLKACQVLHDTLLQIDEEAYNNIETDQTNKEFKRLSIITGDYEK
ncbi:5023_t:CDS:2, partial [Gigaspora margarita]